MIKTPFRQMAPGDGYKVTKHTQKDIETSLHVGVEVKGEKPLVGVLKKYDGPVEIFCRPDCDTTQLGAEARTQMLAEAICRFFNAGGCWSDFSDITCAISQVIPTGLQVDGWYLLDLFQREDGKYVHTWVNRERTEVAQITEDEMIDELSMEDYLKERKEDADGIVEEREEGVLYGAIVEFPRVPDAHLFGEQDSEVPLLGSPADSSPGEQGLPE